MNAYILYLLVLFTGGDINVIARFKDEAQCEQAAKVVTAASGQNINAPKVYPVCLKLAGAQ